MKITHIGRIEGLRGIGFKRAHELCMLHMYGYGIIFIVRFLA